MDTGPADHLSPHPSLTGRDRGFWRGRLYSFRAAAHGVRHTVRTQPNAWIELAAGAVVVALGLWLRITAIEWAILGVVICGVLALEAVNTAVEAIVDLISPRYHSLARVAKDAAAGALIFATLGSLWAAGAIFGPRLLALLYMTR